jgi:hypothetical protein
MILFSAQQFRSTTDLHLHDNADLHVTSKLGLAEISKLMIIPRLALQG